MTTAGHGRTECSCGVVLARWRGWEGPHKEVQVVRDGCEACAGKLRADLEQAVALLRRAAMRITSFESQGPMMTSEDGDTEVLPDIGAFLGRVAKG